MKKIIFFLAISALMACCFLSRANAELSAADKDFLLNQCQVSQEDIDVILDLKKEVQDNISSWIASKDCNQLVPFKNTRDYYKRLLQLKPGDPLPYPLPAGWNEDYLTAWDYANWQKLVDEQPL